MHVIEAQVQWWIRGSSGECFGCHEAFKRGYFVYVIQPSPEQVGLLCRKCLVKMFPEEVNELERTFQYARVTEETYSRRVDDGGDKGHSDPAGSK